MNSQHGNRAELTEGSATVMLPAADLDGLFQRCLGNLELAERVLRKYQDRFPNEVDQLRRLADREDAEQLARAAHRLKGASATIGAAGLSGILTEIETLGRMNRLAPVTGQLEQLETEWTRFLDQVNDFLGEACDR